MKTILPLGTLLQRKYLPARLRGITPGRFIEEGRGAAQLVAQASDSLRVDGLV